jgi:hypothetical protein
LADAGILATHSVKAADGARQPRFSLLRRTDAGFGRTVAENLDLDGLLLAVRNQG